MTSNGRRVWTPREKALVLWQLEEARERGIRSQDVLDAHGAYTSLVAGWRRTPERWPALSEADKAEAAQLLDALAAVTGGVPTAGPAAAPAHSDTQRPSALLEAETEYLRAQTLPTLVKILQNVVDILPSLW